ncbi:hypothetical protein B0H13DRAFT_1887747 [Mycena leptocephala]|nr:hypothetical protein B0H13DRAFT_1887747 [Mycena leptocephala]
MQLPQPSPPKASPPLPCYDIDEILANLTLDDLPSDRPRKNRKKPTPARPSTPPSVPVCASSSPALYCVETPTHTKSEAGNATQGTPHTHVKAVRKQTKRRGTRAAYVVFRGDPVGVFRSWAEAKSATDGLRFSLHQGYDSFEEAVAAFEFAQRQAWTCEAGPWSALAVSADAAPLPIPDGATLRQNTLAPRRADDPFYVVYAVVWNFLFPSRVQEVTLFV